MFIVLVIAVILLLGCVILSTIVPHPITWLMTVLLAAAIGLLIWPKYQAQQAASAHGVVVVATVTDIRVWDRKIGDGNLKTQYEIIATWTHPDTGTSHRFVSAPLSQAPKLHVHDSVPVQVVWEHPEQYQMDSSVF